ncbi:MAG TPA: protocatechuate 3,4-dioxygenase [Chloroflexota bacterium]|nr:protocatechuate 3,4-dioxygenase [Chloroflexota bacterium]
MAQIVLGMATSHGPLLSTPPEEWNQRAEADRRNPHLYFRGRPYRFEELLEVRAAEHFEREITLEKRAARHAACQRAIAALGDTLARVAPDVVVIIGDDQEEVFLDDNMPALAIYWGEKVINAPVPAHFSRPPGLAIAEWGHAPPEPTTVPCAPDLALHLIRSLIQDGFDVAQSRQLPAGRYGTHSIPHAFGFIYRRIMRDQFIPNVPVFINTFYPPNQPSVRRCYEFGQALGRAIAAWDSDKTVAVIASGGLSHFVIEEDLDQQVLAALRSRDPAAIVSLPVDLMESGTSEIRNWIAVAGALADTPLEMQLIDYVPCYRSAAGTGNAMGFAQWL